MSNPQLQPEPSFCGWDKVVVVDRSDVQLEKKVDGWSYTFFGISQASEQLEESLFEEQIVKKKNGSPLTTLANYTYFLNQHVQASSLMGKIKSIELNKEFTRVILLLQTNVLLYTSMFSLQDKTVSFCICLCAARLNAPLPFL